MSNTAKTIQQLNLEDDFLFAKVMTDKEVCRKVLEQILGVSIRDVSIPTAQKTINMIYEGKGIRLDIISIGDDYRKLKKAFVIFICTFDPFGEGRHIYTFENRCKENLSLTLGDETTKIFLNTRGTLQDVNTEMLEFLSYVENSTDTFAAQAASPLIREIHKRVTEVKQNKEMEVEYMTLLQRARENIELGREEGTISATKIIKLYNKGFDIENIAASLQLEPEYVNAVISDYESV